VKVLEIVSDSTRGISQLSLQYIRRSSSNRETVRCRCSIVQLEMSIDI